MTERRPSLTRRTARPLAAPLLVSVAVLVLAGCTSMIPHYERPAAPLPAGYPALAATAAAGAAAASDIEWQRYFVDARLRQLIAVALVNNRDLRIAVLNIDQARATYQIRRADQLPSLGAGVIAQRQASGGGTLVTSYQVGLAMTSYELDFFGRVRSLSEVALAQYLSTEEARKTVQIALIASVANTYLNLLADDELLRVTRETLGTREESLRLTKLKFDNGAASEIEFRQAESLLETARVTLAATARQRALDENALVLLLGQGLPVDM
ncbi:MAG: TolC family protein, partial [Burkholderiaceae bacterium]